MKNEEHRFTDRALRQVVRQRIGKHRMPEGLSDAVMKEIAASAHKPQPRHRRLLTIVAPALSAAALIAILFFLAKPDVQQSGNPADAIAGIEDVRKDSATKDGSQGDSENMQVTIDKKLVAKATGGKAYPQPRPIGKGSEKRSEPEEAADEQYAAETDETVDVELLDIDMDAVQQRGDELRLAMTVMNYELFNME